MKKAVRCGLPSLTSLSFKPSHVVLTLTLSTFFVCAGFTVTLNNFKTRLTYNCAHLRSKVFWVKIFLVKIIGVKIIWVKFFLGENFLGEHFLGECFLGEKFWGENFLGEISEIFGVKIFLG